MNVEALEAYRTRGVSAYYLLEQYDRVAANQQGLRGLYVLPARRNELLWYGLLFVHSGPLSGTSYQLRLQFPAGCQSPSAVPSVMFLSKTFHPFIDPSTGRFDLSVFLASHPDPQVFELLHYIVQSFFKVPTNTMSPLNREAYMLYERFHNPDRASDLSEACRRLAAESARVGRKADGESPFSATFDDEGELRRFRQSLLSGAL